MSKKQFKSQASSGRAGGGFGAFGSTGFGSTQSSPLSYIQEPPEYSGISDANVVVAFKNLSKKDSTTKAKALEEIQAHIGSAEHEVEDGLLEAWVKLYPRLSIDSARRVRQLAHTLTSQLCAKCGKRTVKHLPRIAGPWLAGTYDSDRAAGKAAQDGLSLVFPTTEKIAGLRSTFHSAILEYCRDAVLHETVQTLSDERTVSPEDAQGTYARVIATGVAVITSLLSDLRPDDVSKQHDTYESLFAEAKLWDSIFHADAAVRRSLHRLVQTALAKDSIMIESNIKAASNAYINKGLPSDQTGSMVDYVTTLDELTARFQPLWTDAYTGKKPAITRLKQFLRHGSRSGTSAVWERAGSLFSKIPKAVLPSTFEEAKDVLLAARDGVTRKEERFNALAAWSAYFTLVAAVTSNVQPEDREKVLDSCVMPIIKQYLHPSSETADWATPPAKAALLVAGAACVPDFVPLLEREWPLVADTLIETAKMSQPQQSKDFDKSQLHVAATGERWAALQRELFASKEYQSDVSQKTFWTANVKIVEECLQLLETREGKPFGAAAIIEELLRTCGEHLMVNAAFKAAIERLLTSDTHRLVVWPSNRYLLRCLYAVRSQPFFTTTLQTIFQEVTEAPDSMEALCRTLRDFFPRNTPEEAVNVAQQSFELQQLVLRNCESGPNDAWVELFLALLREGALTSETVDQIYSSLISSLADPKNEDTIPRILDCLSAVGDDSLKTATAGRTGEQLLPALLRLEQHEDENVAQKAAAVSARISSVGNRTTTEARFGVVLQNLERTSRTSLSIDALHDLTDRLLGSDRKVQQPGEMLPSLDVWLSALRATARTPSSSLALLSPLGGAIHLLQPGNANSGSSVHSDADGLSQAMRIAMYVTRLMTDADLKERLIELVEGRWTVVALLYITLLLAEDNLGVLGSNALWNPKNNRHLEPAVLDFIGEANVVLGELWNNIVPNLQANEETTAGSSDYSQLLAAFLTFRSESDSKSSVSYYAELAWAKLNANLFEMHGHNADQTKASEALLRQIRSSKDSLLLSSRIVGLQRPLAGSQTLTRFCNELVADLTASDTSDARHEQKALEQLVLLNLILQTQEDGVATVAKQRLIFLIKHLIPVFKTSALPSIKAEICKALALLLPGIQDMYGEHWAQVLSYLISFWTSVENQVDGPAMDEERTLLTHASLRLYATLRKLATTEEPNDDLVDALKDNSDKIHRSLILLLKSANGVSDEAHQPLMVTHELLGRQISQLPFQLLPDADELYPLLYTPSRPVQQAAFDLLHKQMPAAQEKISFDAALENKTAQLPDELLSLIIDAPTLDTLVDASFDRAMPVQLQGYLYSWRVLFDHFEGSSYRVKSDYIEQLKDGTYLSGLLSFVFDFLGHSRGKPVDASKFDVVEYVPDTETSPERDVQWLLAHLYCLALTHAPSLVKSYYLDIRSRQTSLAVESWTAKYISPLIINASLQAVAVWTEKGVKEDPEYEKMTVKVGMRSKEINVGYVVDDQTMAIKVILPEAYPLASAQVVGVSRVAVKEEKWQSWLRNCQGVITFSNGSITDGLSSWRKNVTGALKGQSECAICYSIIDSQKQLPTKRCPTCKHLFHSSCLVKWFKTSNASTCPLCRNTFNFN